MRSIGIVSDESSEQILSLLRHAARMTDISPCICKLSEPVPERLDMLIVNSHRNEAFEFLKRLDGDSPAIINSDEKRLNIAMSNFKGSIISYGFNQKACVTASSVNEGEFTTVQCCIQRRLPTFSGGLLEQQEFSISSPVAGVGAVALLAYVTAAIVNDIPISEIARL